VTIYAVRQRVACYVTRAKTGRQQLLVYERVDGDPTAPAEIQIPTGGKDTYEAIVEAAYRETEEETGLRGLEFVDQLGIQERGLHDPGGPSVTTFVHVRAPSDGVDQWEHTVAADDDREDTGVVFRCRWEFLPLKVELAPEQAQFLDRLDPGGRRS
jgi:ADP-ribose pyrophosphatase YjhB (NUDIX family)